VPSLEIRTPESWLRSCYRDVLFGYRSRENVFSCRRSKKTDTGKTVQYYKTFDQEPFRVPQEEAAQIFFRICGIRQVTTAMTLNPDRTGRSNILDFTGGSSFARLLQHVRQNCG
jgi:hypothetical protein